jgi:hypothetical protein
MWMTHGSLCWEYLDLPVWACARLSHWQLLALMTRPRAQPSPPSPAGPWGVYLATWLTALREEASNDA